jgi:hypothetical protein
MYVGVLMKPELKIIAIFAVIVCCLNHSDAGLFDTVLEPEL